MTLDAADGTTVDGVETAPGAAGSPRGRLDAMADDERLLRSELRSSQVELRSVQAEIVRERLARVLRSEVNNLAGATSAEASRSGAANVVAQAIVTRIDNARAE